MPATTITIAVDEMSARFKAAIDGSSFSTILVVYDDARQDQPREDNGSTPPTDSVPPAGKPYLRFGIRHADGRQASLGGARGSKKRQEMTGTIFVQVFTPAGDGRTTADELCQIILDGYRTGGATPSGVQFRNAKPVEVGKSGLWRQTNCLIDFTYDQYVGP